MRGVVQRVKRARVQVGGKTAGEIGEGLLLFLGIGTGDTEKDADYLVKKVLNLRIFEDREGRMNCSLTESGGGLLVVSQFTLFGDIRKGMRPSFTKAAKPETARLLYGYFVDQARENLESVETGKFQAMMEIDLINDGPVTILLDSKKEF